MAKNKGILDAYGRPVRDESGKLIDQFGFNIPVKREFEAADIDNTFITRPYDDGGLAIAGSGAIGTYSDLDGSIRTENELITKYREMAVHMEVDAGIEEIVNEAIAQDEDSEVVKINLDATPFDDEIKESIEKIFEDTLNVLQFDKRGHDLFRKWYVDGRMYFHVAIDENNPQLGIQKLEWIDPRKIRKISEVEDRPVADSNVQNKNMKHAGLTLSQVKRTYYMYNEQGFNQPNAPGTYATISGQVTAGVRVAQDSIIHVTSGATDTSGARVLSYLHKAIKPLNQLRTMEDAMVVYRLVRAPERRVWTIDVGETPPGKVDQYVDQMIVKHRNRLVYDASSGAVMDSRKFMTMLEDFWLPTRIGKGS